jgi:hypothetical protein
MQGQGPGPPFQLPPNGPPSQYLMTQAGTAAQQGFPQQGQAIRFKAVHAAAWYKQDSRRLTASTLPRHAHAFLSVAELQVLWAGHCSSSKAFSKLRTRNRKQAGACKARRSHRVSTSSSSQVRWTCTNLPTPADGLHPYTSLMLLSAYLLRTSTLPHADMQHDNHIHDVRVPHAT